MTRLGVLTPLLFLLLLARANSPILAAPSGQAAACATATPTSSGDPGPTVCLSQVVVLVNAASPQNYFTVSWTSVAAETGQVTLVTGGTGTFSDLRGSAFSGVSHYVRVNNVQPGATYKFDLSSGGQTYNNSGQHWSITLGPALPQSPPNNIIGRVQNPDGTDAADAVVYGTIQRADGSTSSLLSQGMDADNAGAFQLSLGTALTTDYSRRFTFDRNNDQIAITAVGPGGSASTTVLISYALPPQPSPPNVTLTLGSGTVTVSTATPSPVPPTSTPTVVPGTATALALTQTAAAFTATPTLTVTSTRPRPTASRVGASRTPTLEPITVIPSNIETATAEASPSSTTEAAAEVTRLAARASPTPSGSSLFAGLSLGDFLFPVALVAFAGAVVLAVAAFFVWKR